MKILLALFGALFLQGAPIILDNGAIRVEVDPTVFAVRFIGVPGGENFLVPRYVQRNVQRNGSLADAGGLRADLRPMDTPDPAILRGPAEIVEVTDRFVALLGAPSDAAGIRIKKEIRLHERAPEAWYTVTAMSSSQVPVRLSLRSYADIAQDLALILPKGEKEPKMLTGRHPISEIVAGDGPVWRISVPPPRNFDETTLAFDLVEYTVEGDRGRWVRRMLASSERKSAESESWPFLFVSTHRQQRYQAIFQTPVLDLNVATPITIREHWIVEGPKP